MRIVFTLALVTYGVQITGEHHFGQFHIDYTAVLGTKNRFVRHIFPIAATGVKPADKQCFISPFIYGAVLFIGQHFIDIIAEFFIIRGWNPADGNIGDIIIPGYELILKIRGRRPECMRFVKNGGDQIAAFFKNPFIIVRGVTHQQHILQRIILVPFFINIFNELFNGQWRFYSIIECVINILYPNNLRLKPLIVLDRTDSRSVNIEQIVSDDQIVCLIGFIQQ